MLGKQNISETLVITCHATCLEFHGEENEKILSHSMIWEYLADSRVEDSSVHLTLGVYVKKIKARIAVILQYIHFMQSKYTAI